jgi:hypothetical protein
LALSGLFYPLAIVSYNVLKVKSDGKAIVRLEVTKRVIMTAVLCYTIPQSVEAIAWGMTAMSAVEFLLNTAFAMRYMSRKWISLIKSIAPSFIAAAAMFGTLFLIAPHIATLNIALRLGVMIITGGAFYIALASLLRLRALREAIELVRGMLAKSA